MHIKIAEKKYYYEIFSQQIRRKGEPNWAKNIEEAINITKYIN